MFADSWAQDEIESRSRKVITGSGCGPPPHFRQTPAYSFWLLDYVVLSIGVVEVDVAAVVDDAGVGTPGVLFDVPDAHLMSFLV